MTCIATDGKTMAGDGLVHADNVIVDRRSRKVRHLKDGRVVGLAGDLNSMGLLVDWIERGADPDVIPKMRENSVDALILGHDGSVTFVDDRCVPFPYGVPAAIGSGREVAHGAMWMGAGPRRAVQCAASLCTTVGGRITELAPKEPT